ncbi:MAG: hypothetical protein LBM07_02480 [Culturomica sp.]|jgi:hypothetical protein|nr:hypothetical protein [Culturomica sp.]
MEKFENDNNPFKVPEGYFESLDEKIMKRVTGKPEKQRIKLSNILMPYAGLAAIFIMAFLLVQVIGNNFADESRMLQNPEFVKATTTATFEVDAGKVSLDNNFNPSSEDICEYLSTEITNYDLLFAELY